MRGTGIGTSLILIATGAVLAFGVTAQTRGIDLNAVGVILMVVGIFGLLLSFLMLGDWMWFDRPRHHDYVDGHYADDVTRPHEHRRVDSTDVVYEDDPRPRVERVERVRRVRS